MPSLTSPKLLLFFLLIPLLLAAKDFSSLQQQVLGYLGLTTSSPTVTIPQATLIGTLLTTNLPTPIEAFLGIPYVQPPLSHLRFAKPVPVLASKATFLATSFSPRCPGKQLLPPGGGEDIWSEDCLTANVFRPSNLVTDEKLPVMVYIHGGAFNRGTSKMHNTASMLSHSSYPFIAVSFNYRIGALGFLNSAFTADKGLLNLGLWDQVELLQWVKTNIAAFGGDEDNVTLVGLSAGAHSIGHHLFNKKLEGRFQRVVMESGGPTSRALHPYNSSLHETQFQNFLTETGCSSLKREEILTCLRAVSEEKIVEASNTVFQHWNPSVRWAWQPVIDDELIPHRPLDVWKSGKWNKVPILTGFNHNEGTMYVPKTLSTSSGFREFFKTLLPQLSGTELDEVERLYPDPDEDERYRDTRGLDVGQQYKRVEAAYGHYAYVCPVRQTADFASSASFQPPVYLYHWALNRTVLGGANHGDQMWYETLDPSVTSLSENQREVAKVFHGYLVNFVVWGDPNGGEGGMQKPTTWRPYGEKQETMIFGKGNDERAGGMGKGVAAELIRDVWAEEECRFWQGQTGNVED